LSAASLSASSLEIEVTENLLLENIEEVSAKMARIKALGVRFSIDDFGTGYSSLAYIKKLPINTLKIDQTFIRDVLVDKDDACIVESTIAMASRMGIDVISEGVETREQMLYLERCGCLNFQGYLFSPAVPADELATVINKRSQAFAGNFDADAATVGDV
jgi:EAL domain-containing protein (putative c-di-GMP-specific phosphodiesterase class I)